MFHLDQADSFIQAPKFLPTQNVIDFPISALPFDLQINTMVQWAQARLSKVVCVSNVHMLMEGHWSPRFAQVLLNADLLTPDGMPLVWVMSWLGGRFQDRVAGMDILLALCQQAQRERISVFFLGSTPDILIRMRQRLLVDFPDLSIAGMESLPFRPCTPAEDDKIMRKIAASNAGIVFVSLGCPKQEWWMHNHRDQVKAVMVGLGGAFPVYARVKKWAPKWVQKAGLEWLYRLFQEPGRLWKRYATTIPPFLLLAVKQALRSPVNMLPNRFRDDDRPVVYR